MGIDNFSNGKQIFKHRSADGSFVRPESVFRNWIKPSGTPFPPEAGRYHLYISWACPWAHRAAIVRQLMGLQSAISLTAVDPIRDDKGWAFSSGPGCSPDIINRKKYLIEIYQMAQPEFNDRPTVPTLWDRKLGTIVNNESIEICRMMVQEFKPWSHTGVDLDPPELKEVGESIIASNYEHVNNGVYKAGFAVSQGAYKKACEALFESLFQLEERLGKSRYLCGNQLTLADVCLFPTLYRFDMAYYSHFKCNLRHLYEFPNLWGYVRDIYQLPGVSETCFPDHIKRHYYITQEYINPNKIVPLGPLLDWTEPHGRDRF